MDFYDIDIKKIDSQNMASQIASLYTQISDSISISDSFFNNDSRYKNIIKDYDNILIVGMGGSAIGADFAAECSIHESNIPIRILRNYNIPNWVNDKTFVIASSYSGNTEETLSAYLQCLNLKCNSIVVSTGGKLSEIAMDNNIGLIKIPKGYQPRAAIGYSLSIMLLIFEELGLINNISSNLSKVSENCLGESTKDKAVEIAKKIHNKFPVIYSGEGFMETLSIRLKGQLAENSKILSYNSVFPEHNHNEIEGWNNLKELIKDFVVIWIKDSQDSLEINNRMEIVSDMIDVYSNHQIILDMVGESKIEKVFSMIHTIDWISYYLALIYKVDPSPVNNISKLKSLMEK